MKKVGYVVAVAMLVGGCTTAYWQDREHDAADIATITVGMGGGMFVQAGPKPIGYGFIIDAFGVEDGKIGLVPYATALKGVAKRFAVYDFDDVRVKRGKLPPLLKDGDDTESRSGNENGAKDDGNC